MLVRLALETRQHHADADADRLAIMECADETEYREFLARIYGFEAAIENEVERLPGMERMFFASRGKQDRLHADLLALGMSDLEILSLKRCQVRIGSASQAHGWVAVVERHTLLAGILRRHLTRTLPDCMQRAGSYFAAHAETAGARFRTLGEALGDQARRGGALEPTAIVGAAGEAYRAQRQWYAGSRLLLRLRTLLDDPTRRRPPTLTPPLPTSPSSTIPPPIVAPPPPPVETVDGARAPTVDIAVHEDLQTTT